MPSRSSKPAGVCIQLLADKIQKPDNAVPSATMIDAVVCSHGGTRFQPNNITPRKLASRKKAVSTSWPSTGPMVLPTISEKRLQLVPNWYDSTMPDTTLIANDTAKDLGPEARQCMVVHFAAAQPQHFQRGDERRQADGKGWKDDVETDGKGRLNARKQRGIEAGDCFHLVLPRRALVGR